MRERGYSWIVAAALAALTTSGVLVAWSGPGWAEEAASAPEPPAIGLDKLMKLPDSYGSQPQERRGKGLSADQWRDRFAKSDRDVARAEKDLSNAQAALEKTAGSTSSWQMSAPGLLGGGGAGSGSVDGADTRPVSFRLREAVRMRKLAVEEARRAKRDLVVEANLASVPEQWRVPEEKPPSAVDAGSNR